MSLREPFARLHLDMPQPPRPARYFDAWPPVSSEPDHPLAALDGQELAGGWLRVRLGRSSRFGARYFVLLLETDAALALDPVLTGLHHSGPLPSYNWIEVAETNDRVATTDGSAIELSAGDTERLFRLLFDTLPPGGHLMVEYDSSQRAETAWGLAHKVPAIATPLGELLFRVGFGAHFKDWQIAEGGSEGPRKLQAYKPPAPEHAERWRREAAAELAAFLQRAGDSPQEKAARERAERLAALLR